MKKIVLLLIVSITVFQSCKNATGTWKNDSIDKRKREEIKALNDKLFKAIKSGDVATVKGMFSDSLAKSVDLEGFVKNVNAAVPIESYTTLDEYNFVGLADKMNCKLFSDNANVNDYNSDFALSCKEAYTSLIRVPKDKNEFLFLVAYGKYNDDWKVNMFYTGQYRLLGKTAPEYFQKAKEDYAKGSLLDAVMDVTISNELLKVGTKFFQYKNEDSIRVFSTKLQNEINKKYQFPLVLNQIDSKPSLYNVSPQVTEEGVFPRVFYISNVHIADEAALKKEYQAVKKETSQLFPGLNENKKYVFYFVSNEVPSEGRVGENYGFVDTVSTLVNMP
ncbi:MAG TPA: hypothetical protein VFF27_06405 [Bacteroidia bacterium]|jgi:hypothetical protein|nr:hypothetical protein [Bacteroidia bacterium]